MLLRHLQLSKFEGKFSNFQLQITQDLKIVKLEQINFTLQVTEPSYSYMRMKNGVIVS